MMTEQKIADMIRRNSDYDEGKSVSILRMETGQTFRVTITNDIYPSAPDGDYGPPTFQLETSPYYGGAKLVAVGDIYPTSYGDYAEARDGLRIGFAEAFDRLMETLDRHDALDVLDRWLRAFHGGGVIVRSAHPYREEVTLVSYWTEHMLVEAWGQDPDNLIPPTGDMLDEWVAYFEGDVYIVEVEEAEGGAWTYPDADPEDLEWETLEGPVGGYYGEADAISSAAWMVEPFVRQLGALRRVV